MPGIGRRQLIKDGQQVLGRLLRRKKLLLRNARLEGFGKYGVDRSRMKTDAERVRISALKLDRQRLYQHIECRLGCSVGVPPSKLIIGNAANAGGERRENRFSSFGQ